MTANRWVPPAAAGIVALVLTFGYTGALRAIPLAAHTRYLYGAVLLASTAVTNKLTLKYDLPPDGAALAEIAHLTGVTKIDLAGTLLSVSAADLGTAAPRVLERLAARGFSCQELTSRRANLEDVFLSLTGRTLRDT